MEQDLELDEAYGNISRLQNGQMKKQSSYSSLSKNGKDVDVREPAVGTEAGLALTTVEAPPWPLRYAPSSNNPPAARLERNRMMDTLVPMVMGVRRRRVDRYANARL